MRERCFDIRLDGDEWTKDDLVKAVEIITAIAFWMEDHDPGTPVPNWVYLSQPFDREELLQCWHEWNLEKPD